MARKYLADCAQTLESYRIGLGGPAPVDIEPPPAQRFGHDLGLA